MIKVNLYSLLTPRNFHRKNSSFSSPYMQFMQALLAQLSQTEVAYQSDVKIAQAARQIVLQLVRQLKMSSNLLDNLAEVYSNSLILQAAPAQLLRAGTKVAQLVRQSAKNLFVRQSAGLFKGFSKLPALMAEFILMKACLKRRNPLGMEFTE